MASFSFFGNVMSMASVQLAGAKRDALLLSFKDAKVSRDVVGKCWALDRLGGSDGGASGACWTGGVWAIALISFPQLSVVEYDPGTHDLKTLSLHYFEEPELRVGLAMASSLSWCSPGFCPAARLTPLCPPGWVRAECAHTSSASGPGWPLCSHAHLWHAAGGATLPEGEPG